MAGMQTRFLAYFGQNLPTRFWCAFSTMKKDHFLLRTPRADVAFEPDENGFWYHPDFRWDIVPDESPATTYFKDAGYDLYFTEMDDDHPNRENELPCLGWVPTPREGGWFLVVITDTDDGPMAVFARQKVIALVENKRELQ